MDYSLETCQNSFTNDQANFMHTVLQESWPGLVTSVEEIEAQEVTLAPNPTTGLVRYSLASNASKVESIELYDQVGQLVKTFILPNGILDLTDLDSGLYMMNFSFEGGQSSQRVVIE